MLLSVPTAHASPSSHGTGLLRLSSTHALGSHTQRWALTGKGPARRRSAHGSHSSLRDHRPFMSHFQTRNTLAFKNQFHQLQLKKSIWWCDSNSEESYKEERFKNLYFQTPRCRHRCLERDVQIPATPSLVPGLGASVSVGSLLETQTPGPCPTPAKPESAFLQDSHRPTLSSRDPRLPLPDPGQSTNNLLLSPQEGFSCPTNTKSSVSL